MNIYKFLVINKLLKQLVICIYNIYIFSIIIFFKINTFEIIPLFSQFKFSASLSVYGSLVVQAFSATLALPRCAYL